MCSSFRHIILNDPPLWAELPFVNGVHEDFLRAILERSQPQPLELSFVEDETLSNNEAVWSQVCQDFYRVSSLYAQVAPTHTGARTQHLLILPAVTLQQCTVEFLGSRSVHLDFLADRVFSRQAPVLSSSTLVGCTLPLPQCPLKALSIFSARDHALDDRLQKQGSLATFCLSSWGFARQTLEHLFLGKGLESRTTPSSRSLPRLGPIALPLLKAIVVEGSIEVCEWIAASLLLPPTCSRNVTSLLPDRLELGTESAKLCSTVLSRYVPSDMDFNGCIVKISERQALLRLIKVGRCRVVVTLVLDFSRLLVTPGLLCVLPKTFAALKTSDPAPHTLAHFHRHYWDGLASTLHRTFATPTTLHLALDPRSPALNGVYSALRVMENITNLATTASELEIRTTTKFIVDPAILPSLDRLVIGLEVGELIDSGDHCCLDTLCQALHSSPNITRVLFRVRYTDTLAMGYAVKDTMCSLLRVLTEGFPSTVAIDWVAY